MDAIEIHARRSWVPIRWGDAIPQISESARLELRGFTNGEDFWLGPLAAKADQLGEFKIRSHDNHKLKGHLGYVEVMRQSGHVVGEFEIVPDKMSETNYQALRSVLEQVWAGLLFDPEGVSGLSAKLPSPVDLWKHIEQPLREIAAEPRSVLARGVGAKRLEAIRRPAELTASVLRASAALFAGADTQRPGRGNVLVRDVNIPENALVAETLRRLVIYARRTPSGADVATRAQRLLRSYPFSACSWYHGDIATAHARIRHDPRYQRVDQVRQVLEGPQSFATEGPGDARLGVKGISRLYEYWVFLQVLIACEQKYGAPIKPGFDVLGSQTTAGVTRLEIPENTTVDFNGNIHVAFEPRIDSAGTGWQNLENVPHPEPNLAQTAIKPDVAVLRLGVDPVAVIFDAKYVNRHWVEREAAKIHARYSRVRLNGKPLVRQVFAAHPHPGIDFVWAGYGSIPMIPGQPVDLTKFLP